MKNQWSQRAWEATGEIYEKILQLPFIKELMCGSLENEKFVFYIQQDALYLAEYGKVLAGISTKLQKPEHIDAFIGFASESIVVERILHKSYVNLIDFKVEASPSCLLYTSFLTSQLGIAPVETLVAAVLPCFRIYKEVGDYILQHQDKINNPYQSWIDTYGGVEFAESVHKACIICDELAEDSTEKRQAEMLDAYIMCSKMEWKFWESAWNLEKWEV